MVTHLVTTLRDALHENIHVKSIPIKALADQLGMSYSYLANSANPNLEEFHFQLRHLIPLTLATRNFSTLDYIEHACGRTAIVLPKVETGEHVCLNQNLMEMVEHIGRISGLLREALADNKITTTEARDMEGLLFDLVRHCMMFLAEVARSAVK
jgi:AraC-like DNA-binding protein